MDLQILIGPSAPGRRLRRATDRGSDWRGLESNAGGWTPGARPSQARHRVVVRTWASHPQAPKAASVPLALMVCYGFGRFSVWASRVPTQP
jgi:hypothetical protein